MQEQVVYAFIDNQNLNLGISSLGWKLDYKKLRLYLKNKLNVSKAFLFIGRVSGNEPLYEFLQKSGYILIFKPTLEIRKNGKIYVKGNVDAELVLNTMIELPNFDKAVIVSGDGDFYCLINYLESINKLGKLLTPNERYSSLLRVFSKGNYVQQLGVLRTQLQLTREQKERHLRSVETLG